MNVRKYQFGGFSKYYNLDNKNTRKAVNEGTKKFANAGLNVLGMVGDLFSSLFTGIPTTATNPKTISPEMAQLQKQSIQKGMTWLSPLNYGTALATGHGLNAKKGEEQVAKWDPRLQLIGRLGELYAGPKAIKGMARTVKNAVVTRQIDKTNQKPLAMQRPSESPLEKEPQTIQYILDHSKEASNLFVEDIVDSYNKLAGFFNSAPYRQRLKDYYKKKGSMVIIQKIKPAHDIAMQLDNISQATFRHVPLIQVNGFNPFEILGVYIPDSHGIKVRWAAMDTTTPRHEMIHARNKGYPYMDNNKYAMRTKAEMDLQNFKDKDVAASNDLQQLDKNVKYYGNVIEQEPRILNTLIDMQDKGIDINNLNQKVVDKYFKRPIYKLPEDTQSLLTNYEYSDILKALQNFKGTLPLIGYTSYKYFNNGKDK